MGRPRHQGIATVPFSVECESGRFQARGIDLENAVAQEPHLEAVIE